MNTEIIDGILTFDELLEDDYYKAEFEKHVQERLKDQAEQPPTLTDFEYKVRVARKKAGLE